MWTKVKDPNIFTSNFFSDNFFQAWSESRRLVLEGECWRVFFLPLATHSASCSCSCEHFFMLQALPAACIFLQIMPPHAWAENWRLLKGSVNMRFNSHQLSMQVWHRILACSKLKEYVKIRRTVKIVRITLSRMSSLSNQLSVKECTLHNYVITTDNIMATSHAKVILHKSTATCREVIIQLRSLHSHPTL